MCNLELPPVPVCQKAKQKQHTQKQTKKKKKEILADVSDLHVWKLCAAVVV